MQYTIVGNADSGANITVFVPGQAPLVAHESHPNYSAIVAKVLENDSEGITELFDTSVAVAAKFDRLSERVTVAHGRLYFDGEVVDNSLATQVVRFLTEKVEDWKPLVNFFENVQQNPQEHSREQLYTWLSSRDFTITPDGLIVGYKGVSSESEGVFHSINSGTAIVNGETKNGRIPQKVGDVVEMPRGQVTFDPADGCNVGLHVGTYEYANGFAQGALLEVHVNPRDVVSVPVDSDHQKMRVCRYTVVNTIDAPHTVPVLDDWGYWDEEEDWDEEDLDSYFFDDLGWLGEDPESVSAATAKMEVTQDEVDNILNTVVNIGDQFEDTDKRRKGNIFTVEGFDGKKAVGKSRLGLKRKIKISRLLSKKYRKVN